MSPTGVAFPYAVAYGGASQTNPMFLTPNTGLTFVGAKPTLKVNRDNAVKISTSTPTFQLATAGAATTGRSRVQGSAPVGKLQQRPLSFLPVGRGTNESSRGTNLRLSICHLI